MMYVPIDVTEEEYKEVYATFGLAVYLVGLLGLLVMRMFRVCARARNPGADD